MLKWHYKLFGIHIGKMASQGLELEHGNHLMATINDKVIHGLLDTSSMTTLVKIDAARKLNLPIRQIDEGELPVCG
jgi:hypothetical protein